MTAYNNSYDEIKTKYLVNEDERKTAFNKKNMHRIN